MARISKRYRAPRPPRFRWDDSLRYKLLACLDYSLQQPVDFHSTAISHIKKRTGKEVTPKLIEQELKALYDKYGREGSHLKVKDLLSEGSAFLVGYSDDDRDNIRDELARIEPHHDRYWLRSTSRTTPSQDRASSLNDPRQRSATLAGSVSAGRVDEGLPPTQPDRTGPRLRSIREDHAKDTAESLHTLVKLESGRDAVPQTSSLVADRDARIRALERELAARGEQLERIMTENTEQKHYIFTLSNRLSHAESECRRVRDCANSAAEHRDNVAMQQGLRDENLVLIRQIEEMRRQREIIALDEARSLQPSDRTIWQEFERITSELHDACISVEVTLPPPSANGSSSDTTSEEIDSWARRLGAHGFKQFLSLVPVTIDITDVHIVRALAAAAISDLVFESRFPDFLARESPLLDEYRGHILAKAGPQTLTHLDLLATHTATSQAHFTSHILPTTASTLSETFARTLTHAHLVAPNDRTFVGCDNDDDNDDGDGSRPEPAEFAADYHPYPYPYPTDPVARVFLDAFTRALQLKQALVVKSALWRRYRLVFFRPGKAFDERVMIRDGDGQSAFVMRPQQQRGVQPGRGSVKGRGRGYSGDGGGGGGGGGWMWGEESSRDGVGAGVGVVKLCLFPALYARTVGETTREYGVGVEVKSCLVECDNFVRGEDDDRGLDGFTLVVKGLVVV